MPLNPSTKFSATLASIIGGVALVASGTWYTANSLRDITEEIKELRREVRQANADHWTVYDMERWSRQLERLNKDSGIVVPEVGVRPAASGKD